MGGWEGGREGRREGRPSVGAKEAVRESRRDHDKLKKREEDESQMSLTELEDIHSDVKEVNVEGREEEREDL